MGDKKQVGYRKKKSRGNRVLHPISSAGPCSSASSERAPQPCVAGNFRAGGAFDFAPPAFPAVPTEQAPLEIQTQKAQLIGAGETRCLVKTGMKPGQVSHPPSAGQPAVQFHPD